MIVCKKCHKAMKSKTATEFCKCCYPEPKEVPIEDTLIGKLAPMMEKHFDAQMKIQSAIAKEQLTQTTKK